MKIKHILIVFLILFFMVTSYQSVFANTQKIAVVDLQKIISSSGQVKALKKEQDAKNKEITNFIKNAQADINKQTKDDAKKKLVEKYEKQLKIKKEANQKEYAQKLQNIDKSITSQIGQKATSMGYTIVIPKNIVIYGGEDITEELIKVIK